MFVYLTLKFSTLETILLVISGNMSLWANLESASVENLPVILGQVRHNTLSPHHFSFLIAQFSVNSFCGK